MSQIKPPQRQTQTHEPQASLQTDVYTRVTRLILEALEQGARPWMKPWSAHNLQAKSSPALYAITARLIEA